MEIFYKKVSELIADGVLAPPMDGNHGEIHPKTSDYVESGIPFILVPDLKDGIVDLDKCHFITPEQAKTLRKGFSKTGDVLFTHKATIGKVALVDTKKYEYIILTPQVTYYRVKNNKVLDNMYLYYYFLSDAFQKTFRAFSSSGGTRDYLGIVAQRKLPIIYPDINTQHKIADVLSKYDALIHNNNKRIKILEQMAESLYKEWFVRFCFPGYENVKFEDGVPCGWKIIRLSEFGISLDTGSRPSGGIDDSLTEGVPSLGAEAVKGLAEFDYSSVKYITHEYYSKMKHGKFDSNAILVYKDGAYIGKTTIFRNEFPFKTFAANEHIFLMKANNPTYQNYLYFTLHQKEYFYLMQNLNRNAAQPGLAQPDIKRIKITFPSENVIRQFNAIIEPIFDEVFQLAKANKIIEQQRNILLLRLMSGKLEV